MSNYKLVTIDQRFIAETIARTGTYQILEKARGKLVYTTSCKNKSQQNT